MSNYTGSTPETRRAPDWRDKAACRVEDPEMFFPTGTEGGWKIVINEAKAVCRRCPSRTACLNFAMDEGIRDGIFGGLTERERAAVRRRATAKQITRERAAADVQHAQESEPKRTLRTIWNAHAHALGDGHSIWRGRPQVYFEGRSYTPRQLSFILDRGRHPEGRVLTTCGINTCVMPSHLGDDRERTRCGTRPGYQKHLKNDETPCPACRQANTDADNQLRRTGTSKVAA